MAGPLERTMIASLFRFVAVAVAAAALHGSSVAQDEDTLRFVMVTHGPVTDPFWARVKEGADSAAIEVGVEVVYRAPESFDLEKMAALVTAAIEEAPDGLIVSIPNSDALASPIRSAVDAGIPVVSINSGFDVARSLGALLHVGQSEYEAGRVAGDAMRKAGGTKALCVNHELGNVALDIRCKGFIDGFAGSVEVLPVEGKPDEVRETIAKQLSEDPQIDVILALNATIAGEPAVAAARSLDDDRAVHVATFDVTDDMLNEVADGAASFAIDQQPFLQGYLPVQYLALFNRRGVIPVSNISTGPRLVTMEEAQRRLGRTEHPADAAQPGEEANTTVPEAAEPGG
jgi:simple sugar transport system substrate-binding protein